VSVGASVLASVLLRNNTRQCFVLSMATCTRLTRNRLAVV
jgi:hypothetical protein